MSIYVIWLCRESGRRPLTAETLPQIFTRLFHKHFAASGCLSCVCFIGVFGRVCFVSLLLKSSSCGLFLLATTEDVYRLLQSFCLCSDPEHTRYFEKWPSVLCWCLVCVNIRLPASFFKENSQIQIPELVCVCVCVQYPVVLLLCCLKLTFRMACHVIHEPHPNTLPLFLSLSPLSVLYCITKLFFFFPSHALSLLCLIPQQLIYVKIKAADCVGSTTETNPDQNLNITLKGQRALT